MGKEIVEVEYTFDAKNLSKQVYKASQIDEIQVELPKITMVDLAKAADDGRPIYTLKVQSLDEKLKLVQPVPTTFNYVAIQEIEVGTLARVGDNIVVNGTMEIAKGTSIVDLKNVVIVKKEIAQALSEFITEGLLERAMDIESAAKQVVAFHNKQIDKKNL